MLVKKITAFIIAVTLMFSTLTGGKIVVNAATGACIKIHMIDISGSDNAFLQAGDSMLIQYFSSGSDTNPKNILVDGGFMTKEDQLGTSKASGKYASEDEDTDAQHLNYWLGRYKTSKYLNFVAALQKQKGRKDTGNACLNYLNKLGITRIDYMIATHPHSDHVGGLLSVFVNLDVKNVVLWSKHCSSMGRYNALYKLIMDKQDDGRFNNSVSQEDVETTGTWTEDVPVYETDSDGNYVLDENGDKIETGETTTETYTTTYTQTQWHHDVYADTVQLYYNNGQENDWDSSLYGSTPTIQTEFNSRYEDRIASSFSEAGRMGYKVNVVCPSQGGTFTVGSLKFTNLSNTTSSFRKTLKYSADAEGSFAKALDRTGNEESLVYRMEWTSGSGASMILAADIQRKGQLAIVNNKTYGKLLNADIYKTAHHGLGNDTSLWKSSTQKKSANYEFEQAINPSVVLSSGNVDWSNTLTTAYGIRRICAKEMNYADIYTTACNGSVVMTITSTKATFKGTKTSAKVDMYSIKDRITLSRPTNLFTVKTNKGYVYKKTASSSTLYAKSKTANSIGCNTTLTGKAVTFTATLNHVYDTAYFSKDGKTWTKATSFKLYPTFKGNVYVKFTNKFGKASAVYKTRGCNLKKAAQKALKTNFKSKTLKVKKTAQLKVSGGTGPGAITYKSSNKKIATVSKTGKITAKKKGTVTITVTKAADKLRKARSVKVKIKVKK